MDNYEETLKKAKEIYDILDLIDLSQDIIDGNNLMIRRLQIPRVVLMPNGVYAWNIEYQINEDNIIKYINKIINKYKSYIELNNYVTHKKQNNSYNICDNLTTSYAIENYIGLLMTILQAKLMGKAIEEIFR